MLDGAHRRIAHPVNLADGVFRRGPEAERPRPSRRARLQPTSAGCCSSCCSSRRLVAAGRCSRGSSSTARSASRLAYRAGQRRAVHHRAISGSGNCRRWWHAVRVEPVSNPWRGAPRQSASQPACSKTSVRETGNTVIYRRGHESRRVMRDAAGRTRPVAVLIDQHIMSSDAIYVDFLRAAGGDDVRRSRRWPYAPARRVVACLRVCRLGRGRYRLIYEHQVEAAAAP